MAQQVKLLAAKREDLSSNLQHPSEKPGMAICASNLSAVEDRRQYYCGLLAASQALLPSGETLSQRNKVERDTGHPMWSSS